MFPDWCRRLVREPGNVRRVLHKNDSNIAQAARILDEIEQLKHRFPTTAYQAFKASFTCLYRQARASGNRRSFQFL